MQTTITKAKEVKWLATKYWFKLVETERALGKEKKKNKKLESELEKAERKIREQEEEIAKLKWEKDHLADNADKFCSMLFSWNNKNKGQKKRWAKVWHKWVSRNNPDRQSIQWEVEVKLDKCPHCLSNDLRQKSWYSRIVEDIIINPQISIVEYIINQYQCRDCKMNITWIPSNAINNCPFGKSLFAYVLFSKYRLRIPLNKIQESLSEIHWFKISQWAIQNMLSTASKQFKDKYDHLIKLIKKWEFCNADETWWRINWENWWTWLFSNNEVSLFSIEETRWKWVPIKFLTKDETDENDIDFEWLLWRDWYAWYNCIEKAEQQICWVHMLRRIKDYIDRRNSSEEIKKLRTLLKEKYIEMNEFHENKKKPPTLNQRLVYHNKMKQYFIRLWKKKWKHKDTKTFIKNWIIKHEDRLVTYLKYPWSRPENNKAERDLRSFVVLRKISWWSKSEKWAKITAINMSIVETWVKQWLSVINDIPTFGMRFA